MTHDACMFFSHQMFEYILNYNVYVMTSKFRRLFGDHVQKDTSLDMSNYREENIVLTIALNLEHVYQKLLCSFETMTMFRMDASFFIDGTRHQFKNLNIKDKREETPSPC
jgi:hypothetical protein